MQTITGTHNSATVFTDRIDKNTVEQIQNICDFEAFADTKIRIMPDCHLGKGVCIGFTQTITDKIVPSFVGCDIGCGMTAYVYKKKHLPEIDFEKVDRVVRNKIPFGFNIHDSAHRLSSEVKLHNIKCPTINMSRARKSVGTLGGGNHFIEINEDEEHFYIVIHSGSRHLGLEIEQFYTNKAQKILKQINVEEIVKKAKAEGNGEKIQELLAQENEMKEKYSFAYLEGELFGDYINDMKTTQEFAYWNRKAILETLTTGIRTPEQFEEINTIHNYVDTGRMIIRKGAVSANKKEKLIIPINMRDGSLICVGKGNEDWNWSAPHGAGRVLSRTQAEKQLKLEDFEIAMKGVWTTSVGESTLSEAPMAYKPMGEIIANIGDTVEILSVVKPLYNFKAPEEDKFWKKKRN